MESPRSDRGSCNSSCSPGHQSSSGSPPTTNTTTSHNHVTPSTASPSSPPRPSSNSTTASGNKKAGDQPALRSFRIDDILKHTPKVHQRSQSPKEAESIVRPWDSMRIMPSLPPSAMGPSAAALHQLQLSAAHHHLMTGGHLNHNHLPPGLSHPFLGGHPSLLSASGHFQHRHHPYLRVPPPLPSLSSPSTTSGRGSSPAQLNHHHLLNNRSRAHESVDQYEFRAGGSDDGQENEDCDDDDTRSDMSSDISITDGPSHGHHRRSPSSGNHGQSSNNILGQGNNNNGNSPLDALFALTTKALDRVNNDKSAESHSKSSYKDGLSQVKKKRKSRTAFTNTQIFELEKRFLYQKYLSPADRDELATGLGLTGAQVITWFQNRRAKLKRDVEEIKKDVEATKMNFGVPTPTNVSPLIAGFDHDSFAVSKKAAELRVLMHLEQINNGKR